MTNPVRLQLSRRNGFNLQEHSRAVNGLAAVNCARPGKWGNPYKVGTYMIPDKAAAVDTFVTNLPLAFKGYELRGKNLACWCPLDGGPCHADILLELANR